MSKKKVMDQLKKKKDELIKKHNRRIKRVDVQQNPLIKSNNTIKCV